MAAMAARELDALMYRVTGYDTFDYWFFQCLARRADGVSVLLTRAPDLRQAQHSFLD